MLVQCKNCLCLISKSCLNVHEKSKSCRSYSSILLVCKRCDLVLDSRDKVDDHMLECALIPNEKTIISRLEDKINSLTDELKIYKIRSIALESRNEKIENLEELLKIEKIKNAIYTQIIEQKTGIKLSDVVEEKDNGLHIYNTEENKIIPTVVHDFYTKDEIVYTKHIKVKIDTLHTPRVNLPPKHLKENSDNKCEKHISFDEKEGEIGKQCDAENNVQKVKKSLKKKSKEASEEEDSKTTSKKKKRKSIKKKEEDDDIELDPKDFIESPVKEKPKPRKRVAETEEEHLKCIKQSFLLLKEIRAHKKVFENLKFHRKSLTKISMTDYHNLIKEHVQFIEDHLLKKDYSKDKILAETSKYYLTPLESRMLSFGDYWKTEFLVDEITQIYKRLDLDIPSKDDYEIFSREKFYNKFLNYSSVICDIKILLGKFLFNKFGKNNIVYINNPKSTAEDPYSFYILSTIKNDVREWTMECRLLELCKDFSDTISKYLIDMFRKIYFIAARTNDFIRDNPDIKIMFTGSTSQRTNLYHRILRTYYFSFSKDFKITALAENEDGIDELPF